MLLFQEFHKTILLLIERYQDDQYPVQNIQSEIIKFFQIQCDQISVNDRIARYNYEKAKYAMVGFADEFFLRLDWKYRAEWLSSLLEEKIFKTHISGSKLFDEIDIILHEKENIELASIYFTTLAFGFKGRYLRNDSYLTRTKTQLFIMMHHFPPRSDVMEAFGSNYAIEKCVNHTSYDTRYFGIFWISSVILYLGLSYVIWDRYTTPIVQLLAEAMI